MNITIKSVITLILLSMTTISLANEVNVPLKKEGVLGVCYYTQFKPISYGKAQGYEPDLARAVAKLWKVKIEFHPEDTYNGIWHLPSWHNSCDISLGGITPSKDRVSAGATFSLPTAHYDQSLLVRKKDYQSGRITSYASFKGTDMKIGVVPGTTGEQYAHIRARNNQLMPDVFVQYPSEADLLPALLNGKIDAIARGELGNEHQAMLNKNLMTIAKQSFDDSFCICVNAKNQKLLAELNKAITKITHDGKIGYAEWRRNHQVFNIS